jgi:hypothetical protein
MRHESEISERPRSILNVQAKVFYIKLSISYSPNNIQSWLLFWFHLDNCRICIGVAPCMGVLWTVSRRNVKTYSLYFIKIIFNFNFVAFVRVKQWRVKQTFNITGRSADPLYLHADTQILEALDTLDTWLLYWHNKHSKNLTIALGIHSFVLQMFQVNFCHFFFGLKKDQKKFICQSREILVYQKIFFSNRLSIFNFKKLLLLIHMVWLKPLNKDQLVDTIS